MTAIITEAQATTLRGIRAIRDAFPQGYKAAKNAAFAAIKDSLGVPSDIHCKVEIDDRASPEYRKLKGRCADGTWGYITADGRITPSDDSPQPAPAGQDDTAAPSRDLDFSKSLLGAITLTTGSDDSLETFDQTLLNVTEVLLRVTDALMLRLDA